ncbi:hypothetical protein MJD09_10010 [bacterium]|nr:hypothetical protein [bacterium]
MRKFTVISIVLPLLLSMAYAAPDETVAEKKKPREMVVLEIENTRFSSGRAYITNQYSVPRYLGRVSPGLKTQLRFFAPINDDYHTLFVTVGGRVTNVIELNGNIEDGDKIEWDLFSNWVTWKAKEPGTPAE